MTEVQILYPVTGFLVVDGQSSSNRSLTHIWSGAVLFRPKFQGHDFIIPFGATIPRGYAAWLLRNSHSSKMFEKLIPMLSMKSVCYGICPFITRKLISWPGISNSALSVLTLPSAINKSQKSKKTKNGLLYDAHNLQLVLHLRLPDFQPWISCKYGMVNHYTIGIYCSSK